jgi:hypothetical protein
VVEVSWLLSRLEVSDLTWEIYHSARNGITAGIEKLFTNISLEWLK